MDAIANIFTFRGGWHWIVLPMFIYMTCFIVWKMRNNFGILRIKSHNRTYKTLSGSFFGFLVFFLHFLCIDCMNISAFTSHAGYRLDQKGMFTEIMCADRYSEMFTNLEAAYFTSLFISFTCGVRCLENIRMYTLCKRKCNKLQSCENINSGNLEMRYR